MRSAQEIYGEGDDQFWFGISNYQPMLEEFGEICVQVDDNDYQGDSRVLYRDGDGFGFLQFGWGSCSGCDALMACNSIEEVQELMDELLQKIMWFDSSEKALAYFTSHDWKGDYSWHEEEQAEFITKVIEFLREQHNG